MTYKVNPGTEPSVAFPALQDRRTEPRLPTFCLWCVAPNRHMECFVEDLYGRGCLRHVFYERTDLLHPQLGTMAQPGSAPHTFLGSTGRDASEIARLVQDSGVDCHVVVGFAGRVAPQVLMACLRGDVPCFQFCESLEVRGRFDPVRLVRDAAYSHIARRLAGVFTLSKRSAADFLRLGVPPAKLFPAVYPGPAAVQRTVSGARRIVFCGRVVPLKGIDILCTALEALVARQVAFEFEVIGSGELLRSSMARLRRAGVRARVHGALPTNGVLQTLAAADALVLPTRTREGWGYVVNEALACGVAAVVSDVVGAQDVVVPGRTGFIFPSEDAAALEQALEAALDLRQRGTGFESAVASIHAAISPASFGAYFASAMSAALWGGRKPSAPWLDRAKALGGSPSVDWWQTHAPATVSGASDVAQR